MELFADHCRTQTSVAGLKLILDPEKQLVSCHGIIFELSPMQFAKYAVIAKRRIAAPEGDGFVHWTEISGEEFIKEFARLPVPGAMISDIRELEREFRNIGKPGYENDDDPRAPIFQQAKTRLNSRLRKTLGPYSVPYELIARKGVNSQWFTGIKLPADAVSFGLVDPGNEDTGTG